MKKSIKLMMGLVIAFALPMCLTSCDEILGEWDNPTPNPEPTVKVTSITISPTEATIDKGSTETLTVSVAPDNANDKTVTWSSSDKTIATVADGVVTAVAVGTATITATANDGSGIKATCEVTVKFPGLLAGRFTVNVSGGQVQFSQGNLQATYNGTIWTWAFAENQWVYIGNAAGNIKVTDVSPFISENGTVDLFGWVGASSSWTGVAQYGINSSGFAATSTIDGYGNVVDEPLKSDWGTLAIINGGNTANSGWRTLTSDECKYLFYTRDGATSVNGTANARYTHATINTDGTGVHGLILFPDGVTIASDEATSWGTFNATSDADLIGWDTKCTSAQWTALAAKGCVFLPAAGVRNSSPLSINGAGSVGFYWTSSHHSTTDFNAQIMTFQAEAPHPGSSMNVFKNGRYAGGSVRLVRDVE